MRKLVLLGLAVVLLTMPALAADFEHREFAVRASGMGGTSVAFVDDINSLDQNIAGLAAVDRREVFVTYRDTFGLFGLNNFALSQPLLGGGLGISMAQLANSEEFNYKVTTWQAAYARELRGLWGGVAFNYNSLDSQAGQGNLTSVNFGLQGKLGKLAWGVAINNLVTLSGSEATRQSAPIEMKAGIALANDQSIYALELVNGKEVRIGLERQIIKGIALRVGLNDGTPTLGLGLKKGELWAIDYSFELGALGSTHALGLKRCL